jgi:hypothetical protein
MPDRYRLKMIFEAKRLSAATRVDIMKWAGDNAWFYESNAEDELYIQTDRGCRPASNGDWIVKDGDGVFSVCSPNEFSELYELIS